MAPSMAVPKTSMNEYNRVPFAESDVWSTGKVPCVQPISVTESVKETSNCNFGPRVS